MKIIVKGIGLLVGFIGTTFTALLALITIMAGTIYDKLIHSWLSWWLDTPFAYVSVVYHSVVYHFCYKFLLQMRVEVVGEIPEKHKEKSVIFVPGIHPPLLLLIPYYYLICKHICARLLTTSKESNASWRHPFGLLVGIPLKVMRCIIFLPRGKGREALEAAMAELAEGLRAYRNHQRAFTLHVDMSRPSRKKIEDDRKKFSKILFEKYGIVDDLSWLTSTLFPRLHAFAATIEALPNDARVVFLFMGQEQQIWSTFEVEKLFGSTLQAEFIEIDIVNLKRQVDETKEDWEKRLTLKLIELWRNFNSLDLNH